MSNAVARAITSLGTIEDRLRRALNLAGDVNAQFTPAAIPVIQAFDATIPGCATDRGKRFALGITQLGAAVNTTGFEARRDVVITSMRYAGTTALTTVISARILVPGTTADFAMDATGGTIVNYGSSWVERPASNNDLPPIIAGQSAGTFATGKRICCFPPQGTVWTEILKAPFFMEGPRAAGATGTRITFTNNVIVANDFLVVEGYVF